MKSSPIRLTKQKLSPKAAAAKKARDIAAAKTTARKRKKAQNQRIGQRSDSDIHHDGTKVKRISIKNNRGFMAVVQKRIMARQDKKKLKVLPAARVAKKAKNMLVQGAAAMSGKSVKSIAASLVGGAIGEAAMDKRKIRRKAQRKEFIKSLQKTKKPSVTVDPKEIKTKILKDEPGQYYTPGTIKGKILNDKKTTNKMKKESTFKMKGFSGFKNESPTKQKGKANATKETTYKNPKMKQDNYASRSDTVLASAKNYPGYYSLNKENKAKVQGAIDRLDGYVPSNKEAYRQFKGR